MPRHRQNAPLQVLLNNKIVGLLLKEPSGAISFRYDPVWLNRENAIPVSLSLPLREDVFKGAPVQAVFENLLPDSETLRRMVAAKVGAGGTDAYSLLAGIGRDCVALCQFLPEGEGPRPGGPLIKGEFMDERGMELLLKNLAKTPLGLDGKSEFRISVAGAQEKTALLWHKDHWIKPHGTTPTSHILKTQMGTLPNGMDLTNSVENEFYCLKLLRAFGLPAAAADIVKFGACTVLKVSRFDRQWTSSGRLLRLPQEDCCQALSVPPGKKYQSDGGPGMVAILDLLKGGDNPLEDQTTFLKAQILFWLSGQRMAMPRTSACFSGREDAFVSPLCMMSCPRNRAWNGVKLNGSN